MTIDFNAVDQNHHDPNRTDTAEAPVILGRIEQPNPLDPAPAKARLMQHHKAIEGMLLVAEETEITSVATDEKAIEMAGQARKLFKAIEDLRKEIVAQPNEFVKTINALAKIYTAKLTSIGQGLMAKHGTWDHQQEMNRREAERKAREAAEKLQARINAEAEKKHIKPVVVPPPVIPKAGPTRTAEGSASTRKVWVWEVEDHSAIPFEWMVLDEKKVNQAVRLGTRNIAGIRIFQETKTVLRT